MSVKATALQNSCKNGLRKVGFGGLEAGNPKGDLICETLAVSQQ